MKKSNSFYLCILGLVALLVLFMACGGGGGGGGDDDDDSANIEADVKITAFQFAEVTIFSVIVNSVTGVTDAASFNMLGDETRPNTNLGETADNFVNGETTIIVQIYNSAGDTIASVLLDAADYPTPYEGTLTLSAPGASLVIETDDSLFKESVIQESEYEISSEVNSIVQQIAGLDILASGVFDVLPTGTRSIIVPLNCGPATPGSVTPAPNEGYFIINDVIIEYYYALANPVEFNNVLSVKFRESGRNFENMTLAFRLPNSSNTYRVRPKPFKLLDAAEVQTILGNVATAVNSNNPFETAIAYVDLEVTAFGPSYLVETTVTRVEGDCVAGAKSFTVQEGSEQPEPPKAIGDEVDKNTQQKDLILYILGNEVQVRDQELDSCGTWSPTNSGGAEGTLDRWDISDIPAGASFDFRFQAYSIPDIFVVEYPYDPFTQTGTEVFNSGWRGSSPPDNGDPLSGPGSFEELNLFVKGTSDTIKVLVTGEQSGTAWNYSIRCNDP